MGPVGVNLLGTAHTVKHAARRMMTKGGSIVAISSIASLRPASFMATYNVTKAAVDELVRTCAAELGRFGIRVNGVRPGWVATETVATTTTSENMAIIRDGTPLAGLSAHADREDLLRWAAHFKSQPRQVFLTHGEERAALSLAEALRAQRKWDVSVPEYRSAVDLL